MTVLPVRTTFFTARMTIAAALASRPDVGSSKKIIDGFATSSTAIVKRLRCSVERPLTPAYANGDTQNPHFNQAGMEAVARKHARQRPLLNCKRSTYTLGSQSLQTRELLA